MTDTRKKPEKHTPRWKAEMSPPRNKDTLAETVGRVLALGVIRLLRAQDAEKKAIAEAQAPAEKKEKAKRKSKKPARLSTAGATLYSDQSLPVVCHTVKRL